MAGQSQAIIDQRHPDHRNYDIFLPLQLLKSRQKSNFAVPSPPFISPRRHDIVCRNDSASPTDLSEILVTAPPS